MCRKHKAKSPRRLRMKREQRLQSARAWLVTQKGRTPARIGAAYRRWFGVDWPCTIEELTRLGITWEEWARLEQDESPRREPDPF
jgi:hypothetical protein